MGGGGGWERRTLGSESVVGAGAVDSGAGSVW